MAFVSFFLHVCAGACGGELACSTCHLVFEQEVYDTLPPKEDEEEDMLDLAFEVTETYVATIYPSWDINGTVPMDTLRHISHHNVRTCWAT